MRLTNGPVICACGWRGTLAAKAPCPSCNRPAIDRMDAGRIAVLRKVLARPDAEIKPPSLPHRLIAIGVLRRDSPPTPPNDDGRHRQLPRRRHAVTALGLAVLATVDAIEAEQRRRHHVAAGVARHAGIEEP